MSPIINARTEVSAQKSIGEVTAILMSAGARQIMTEFDDRGCPSGVTFTVPTSDGMRAFSLPVNVDKVAVVLKRQFPSSALMREREQAERVAWRIAKEWLRAQMAIVETEMVTLDQVMLPYMRTLEGKTVYELFKGGAFPALGTGE